MKQIGIILAIALLLIGSGAGLAASQEVPTASVKQASLPVPLTPKPPPEPRINGPKVFGVRPGHPLVFTIPATGDRPMAFSARGLPEGLNLEAATGRLSGVLKTPGEHNVTLIAQNARGKTERAFRIVVGEKIALTPPMGWNSWNCWGGNIDARKIRAAAKGMVESGLINHGWSYINIDDAWQGLRAPPEGALQGNDRFPDMGKLCDEVHALGLKIGLYSTPWRISFAGYAGEVADTPDGKYFRRPDRPAKRPEVHDRPTSGPATAPARTRFEHVDARQWARWGIDYLKYDWRPIDPHNTKMMGDALRASGRDIVYSLSNAADFDQAATWAELANCWRTTRDIRDSWASMSGIGFSQDRWKQFAGPGHWNDPDMLYVGRRGNGRPSNMTPDEQYTHISLWCLLAAPLLLGCDLQKPDDFTLGLLTNDEVLEVNQDSLGKQAGLIHKDGDLQVWVKDMEDGSKAIGLFNLGPSPMQAAVPWKTLHIEQPQRVRDLWRQCDLPNIGDQSQTEIPSHGVMLMRAWPGGRP
jgi:alpha-galactosidase